MRLFFESRRVEDMGGRAYLIMDLVKRDKTTNSCMSRYRVGSLLLGETTAVPSTDGVYYVMPGLYSEVPREQLFGLVRRAIELAKKRDDADRALDWVLHFKQSIFSIRMRKWLIEINPFLPSKYSFPRFLDHAFKEAEKIFQSLLGKQESFEQDDQVSSHNAFLDNLLEEPEKLPESEEIYRIPSSKMDEYLPDSEMATENAVDYLDYLIYHWLYGEECLGFKIYAESIVVHHSPALKSIEGLPREAQLNTLTSRALIILGEDLCAPDAEKIIRRITFDICGRMYQISFEIVKGSYLLIWNVSEQKGLCSGTLSSK